ncbi:MAG: Uma2 family endonuclease, partial [Chloroflexaceae bacterium]|nr:Uma2 family endonuclease [Chloroflexaceae bacterium]
SKFISRSETARSIAEKVSDYLQAGTTLLWLVYPDQRTVQEYQQRGTFHIYRPADTLDGRDVLAGFAYPLAELFG